MTILHTQGQMQAGVSMFHGREVFTAVPTDNVQKIVALFGFCGADDEAESIANLRRFVALWNKAEGLSTEKIDQGLLPGDLSWAMTIDMLSRDRDELLGALKGLLAYFESGKGIATGRAVIKTDSLEVRAAYTAIAKVEGGAA